MKSRIALFITIICCLILVLSCSSGDDVSLVGDPDKFVGAMMADNLVVKEGFMKNVNIIESCCDPTKLMPMCYANNPGAPYLTAYLPEADGQTRINSPLNYYGYPPPPASTGIGKARSYRLAANEAIVIVGKTPPATSVYYSYISYLTLRCVTANCNPGATPDFTNDYKRRFASMVDELNNQTIWTAGTPGGKTGNSFDKHMMIIITSDQETNRRIRQAAHEAGYSDLVINTIILPAEFVKFGIDYGKDEIGIVHRLAAWDDNYIANPPARAFRVGSNSLTLDPFPTPALTPRGGKQMSEKVLFNDSIAALRSAILTKYSDYAAMEYKTDRWVPEGRDCLAGDTNGTFNGYDCLGDNHDAIYLRFPDLAGGYPPALGNTFSLDNNPNDFIIVYGVNHTKSGFTVYSSISTYRHAMLNGGNTKWIDAKDMSAIDYLKNTPYASQAEYLYVLRVARSCSGITNEPCMEFPDCSGCPSNCKPECKTTGANDLFLGMRAYLETATGVGPSYDEVIWDKAIHFRK